jgi:hypothetical protein
MNIEQVKIRIGNLKAELESLEKLVAAHELLPDGYTIIPIVSGKIHLKWSKMAQLLSEMILERGPMTYSEILDTGLIPRGSLSALLKRDFQKDATGKYVGYIGDQS